MHCALVPRCDGSALRVCFELHPREAVWWVGEGGREGRKEGGRVGMGREAEGGMMEEGSKIGREGGREEERLKLGGGGV